MKKNFLVKKYEFGVKSIQVSNTTINFSNRQARIIMKIIDGVNITSKKNEQKLLSILLFSIEGIIDSDYEDLSVYKKDLEQLKNKVNEHKNSRIKKVTYAIIERDAERLKFKDRTSLYMVIALTISIVFLIIYFLGWFGFAIGLIGILVAKILLSDSNRENILFLDSVDFAVSLVTSTQEEIIYFPKIIHDKIYENIPYFLQSNSKESSNRYGYSKISMEDLNDIELKNYMKECGVLYAREKYISALNSFLENRNKDNLYFTYND